MVSRTDANALRHPHESLKAYMRISIYVLAFVNEESINAFFAYRK
jgi:hypothetical protein